MKILLASTTALFLTVMPAHAQLIGGGGLGGSLGGALGGAGSIGSVGLPIETVGTATRGTAKSSARTSGSQSVDRKSGAVHADRSADGNVTGTAAQMVSAPTQMMSGTGSANAAGRANGSSDAQLIGTDAVNQASASTLATTRGTVSGATLAARNTTGGMAPAGRQAAGGMSSKAMGSATGNGSGMFSGAMGRLAAAGSLAAAGNGNFAVSRGMRVFGPDGNRLGKVRSVIADTRGQVQAELVKVDGASTTLPAANFSGSGNALVSAMGKSQIKQKSATK